MLRGSILWSSLLLVLVACASAPPAPSGIPAAGVPQINPGDRRLLACHEAPELTVEGGHCVWTPREHVEHKEAVFRRKVGEPDWSGRDDAIGVSLSGGGTRAAASAMGVLAGLDDLKLLTHVRPGKGKKVELVSSVSGGGYSAYFLFTHLLHEARPGTGRGELFQDCVSYFFTEKEQQSNAALYQMYSTVPLRKALDPYLCDRDRYIQSRQRTLHAWEGDGVHQLARHQALVRCHQDVLQPSRCSTNYTSQDGPAAVGGIVAQVGASVVTAIPHHLLNSLFDSGLNIAPSRSAYVDGIDATYGALVHPAFNPLFNEKRVLAQGFYLRARVTCPAETSEAPASATQANYSIYECDPVFPGPRPPRLTLAEFSARLNAARSSGDTMRAGQGSGDLPQVPYWVIQSTAAPTRGLAGWVLGGALSRRQVRYDTFEITANHFGSLRYGLVHGNLKNHELIDAVASSAAFLDSNQTAVDSVIARPVLGAAQHAFNANWGIDIANYNVSPARRSLHRALPFPLNNLDSLANGLAHAGDGARVDRQRSVFIRLLDGGNIDNLGLYAHVRRGMKNVVVADVSEDEGVFGDLCLLRRALAEDPEDAGRQLHIPGLQDFATQCDDLLDRGAKDMGYKLTAWTHQLPVLLGCVQLTRDARAAALQCIESEDAPIVSRLIIYKPSTTEAARGSIRPRIAACKVIDYKPESAHLTAVSRLLRGDDPPITCTDPAQEAVEACRAALPCETARLMRANVPGYRFPLGSTVLATANSSGTLFAGYRELARHAMHGAQAVIAGERAVYEAAVKQQARYPLQRVRLP